MLALPSCSCLRSNVDGAPRSRAGSSWPVGGTVPCERSVRWRGLQVTHTYKCLMVCLSPYCLRMSPPPSRRRPSPYLVDASVARLLPLTMFSCFDIEHDDRRDGLLLRKLSAVPGATAWAVESVAAEATQRSMSPHSPTARSPLPSTPPNPATALPDVDVPFRIDSTPLRHTAGSCSVGSSLTLSTDSMDGSQRRSTDASNEARAASRRRWRAVNDRNGSSRALFFHRRDSMAAESHAFRVFDEEVSLVLDASTGGWTNPAAGAVIPAVGDADDHAGDNSSSADGKRRAGMVKNTSRHDPARRLRYHWGATRRHTLRRALDRFRRRRTPSMAVASAPEVGESEQEPTSGRLPDRQTKPAAVLSEPSPLAEPNEGFPSRCKALSILDDEYVNFQVAGAPDSVGARKHVRFVARPGPRA